MSGNIWMYSYDIDEQDIDMYRGILLPSSKVQSITRWEWNLL